MLFRYLLTVLVAVVVSQEIKITAATANVATGMKTLHGHFESVWKTFKSSGQMVATNELRLAIGLSLRDPAGLENFLADIYNPASTNYHHYLTVAE